MIVFYIDPQSYNNLSFYDKSLITNFSSDIDCFFFASVLLPSDISFPKIHKIFRYQMYSNFLLKIASYIFSYSKIIYSTLVFHPDIIHIQWLKIPIFDLVFIKLIRLLNSNVKLIFTAHNVLPHNTGDRYKKIYKKIYLQFDSIIVHDTFTRDILLKNFVSKNVYVVPHGLLTLTTLDYPKYIASDNHDINFLFFGSISMYKGIDIIVDAWVDLISKDIQQKANLVIAGAGKIPKFNDLILLDKVKIYNYFLTDEELNQLIQNADVILLPYRMISQSGVLLTSLSYHKPVIVSPVGGLIQPFEVANVGYVLSEVTAEALANVVTEIIDNPSILKKIAQDIDAWKKIEKYYDWCGIANKTEDLYKS